MKNKIAGFLLSAALSASPGCSDKSSDASRAPAATRPAASAAASDGGPMADWIPAEFKVGTGRWRDPFVYVDGIPAAVIRHAEMPRKLRPIWIEETEALDFKPGDTGPRERKYKVPRYRIVEYLEALGIDVAKIEELHIHGGPMYAAVVAGSELRRTRDRFLFDFANENRGRVRPFFPADLKTNTHLDRIGAITVYIDRKPPRINAEQVLELDGQVVDGIPYFGEPVRGGVRVYLDDRLATVIKRNKLTGPALQAAAAGEGRWKLFAFLQARGVDTSEVAVAELIHRNERSGRLDRSALETIVFAANPQASGEVLLGDERAPVSAIMMYRDAEPPK